MDHRRVGCLRYPLRQGWASWCVSDLREFVLRAGLATLSAVLKQERTELCGPRYAHLLRRQARRAGSAPGELVLGWWLSLGHGRACLLRAPPCLCSSRAPGGGQPVKRLSAERSDGRRGGGQGARGVDMLAQRAVATSLGACVPDHPRIRARPVHTSMIRASQTSSTQASRPPGLRRPELTPAAAPACDRRSRYRARR